MYVQGLLLSLNMYYYVFLVTNLVAMPTMYILTNHKTNEEKGHPLSHFYNIDHRQTRLVCMCRSTTPLFKTAILPNIRLVWLPWQQYIGLIVMGEMWEKVFPSPVFAILITQSQFLLCMCRSTSHRFKYEIIPNTQLIWLP